VVIFSALIIFEMYLMTGFLPAAWQHALNERLTFHDEAYKQSVRTHPLLNEEIDQALRENLGLRIAVYLTFGVLLTGNTFLIWRVWGCLKIKRTPE
jgi:hypothetical protein